MKERPILFSGPMVKALLDGRKTQTRRIAKVTDQNCKAGFISPLAGHAPRRPAEHISYCPYGKPGDRFWVKETWRVGAWDQDQGFIAVDYRADGYARQEWLDPDDPDVFEKLWIESSDEASDAEVPYDSNGEYHWKPGEAPTKWRPSIFMYRWASRITLELTGVRVERLQDISEADALAEGYPHPADHIPGNGSPQGWYSGVWDSINGPNAWHKNPWVWVLAFKWVPPCG